MLTFTEAVANSIKEHGATLFLDVLNKEDAPALEISAEQVTFCTAGHNGVKLYFMCADIELTFGLVDAELDQENGRTVISGEFGQLVLHEILKYDA